MNKEDLPVLEVLVSHNLEFLDKLVLKIESVSDFLI
jgi:hypothetical protein